MYSTQNTFATFKYDSNLCTILPSLMSAYWKDLILNKYLLYMESRLFCTWFCWPLCCDCTGLEEELCLCGFVEVDPSPIIGFVDEACWFPIDGCWPAFPVNKVPPTTGLLSVAFVTGFVYAGLFWLLNILFSVWVVGFDTGWFWVVFLLILIGLFVVCPVDCTDGCPVWTVCPDVFCWLNKLTPVVPVAPVVFGAGWLSFFYAWLLFAVCWLFWLPNNPPVVVVWVGLLPAIIFWAPVFWFVEVFTLGACGLFCVVGVCPIFPDRIFCCCVWLFANKLGLF